MPLSPDLLDILACPVCRSNVTEKDDYIYCANPECNRRYPIRDNIPCMLPESAEIIPDPAAPGETNDS